MRNCEVQEGIDGSQPTKVASTEVGDPFLKTLALKDGARLSRSRERRKWEDEQQERMRTRAQEEREKERQQVLEGKIRINKGHMNDPGS